MLLPLVGIKNYYPDFNDITVISLFIQKEYQN